jgi:hypothetical protein
MDLPELPLLIHHEYIAVLVDMAAIAAGVVTGEEGQIAFAEFV